MRSGQQIDLFGQHVNEKLDALAPYLPSDLVIVATSSQPVQVKEQIDLFMDALYEAIGLVVIVSLLGFWEWRSALLMALSIPDHAGDDLRRDLRAGHRYSAGIGGFADHRLGLAGGRSRRRGRLHQAHAGRRTSAHRRALAGPDQDRGCHHVRDDHQHRRLSAVPDDHRNHRRVHLQLADSDDGALWSARAWPR